MTPRIQKHPRFHLLLPLAFLAALLLPLHAEESAPRAAPRDGAFTEGRILTLDY